MGETVVDGASDLLGDSRGSIQEVFESVPHRGGVGIGFDANIDLTRAYRFSVLVLFGSACAASDGRHAGNSPGLEFDLASNPVGLPE